MGKFICFISVTGLSLIFSFVAGALFGLVFSYFKPDHPHQIIPSWLLFGILTAGVGIVSGIISASVVIVIKQSEVFKLALISAGIAFLLVSVYSIVSLLSK